MIEKLILLLHVYLITQKTFANDPIVVKEYPASIRCQRTKGQVAMEKQLADTDYYQSCYDYEIDDNDKCSLMKPEVYDLNSFTFGGDTIYTVDTPVNASSLVYPNDKICFFEIGKRKKGFVYQYQYYFPALYQQDIEGSLTIDDDGITAEVTGGLCPDFFEFREKEFDKSIPTNKLVTCGNITDPRIQFAVDVASKLTLVFKSNEQNGYNGLYLSILEYMPSTHDSRRKKKDIKAPQGLQGAFGDTGQQGAPGKLGSTGNPGRDGSKGIKGKAGVPGVIGPEGDIGLPGKIGIPGDIGPAGPKGRSCTCPSFADCEPGSPGKKGAKGLRGIRGDIGPRGFRGQPGIPGLRGLPGDKGRKGDKGTDGIRGLPGPRGDQGLPGLRGRIGPPGPPGLRGCPLPSDNKLSRHIREVEHIFSTMTELYNNFGLENQMSADEFYDYIMKKPSIVKDTLSGHLYSDESRVARSTESSTDCNSIPVIPGPVGDQGVPGLPGDDGIQGKPGLPGVDGTTGKAGDPGTPGPQGSKGSRGKKGPRGPKGDKGATGAPGDSGFCRCYQDKGKTEVENITFLQRTGNGIPGKPGVMGPHGLKGPPGSVGEKGLPGTTGIRGPKGFKGVNGVPGRTGFNGSPGDKGQRGQRGVRGPTGPPGPPGPPGCVCNNLIILLDEYGFVSAKVPDLTELDDDRNCSKQENTSTEFLFRPNITCIRNDSGAAITGPKGEPGLPGFPGATGNPGIPGLPGKDGIPGIKGRHGDPGLPGDNGERGLKGEIGKKGATGINGIQGLPGKNTTCILGAESETLIAIECPRGCPNGLDGAVGDKGDTGPKGSSGLKGFRGLSGPPGPQGVAGSPGLLGDEGSVGMPGVKGLRGLRGLPGAVGPAGPPGPPGPRDSCPEYDGVDFDMLLSPSKEDINMIKYLINTPNIEVATNMTNRNFPLLRILAKLIIGGYKFPKSNPPSPPVVIIEDPVVNLTVNDYNLIIKCLPNMKNFNYKWIKKNDVLPSRAQGVNTSQLTIVNLKPEDSGDYKCVMSNSTGTISSEFSTVKITVSLPTISEHPNDMNINVLNSVSFKCTAQGFGVLKIVWKRVKYNIPLTAVVTEEKTLNTITSILKFTTTTGYYSGQYYCVAEGEAGEVASQTANLHIQAPKPEIIISPKNVTVLPNHSFTMNCLALSFGLLKYDWSKRDGILPQTAVQSCVHNILFDLLSEHATSVYNLAVYNVQPSDEGWYCCVATNEAGSTEDCAWLEVNTLPNITTQPVPVALKSGDLNVIAMSCSAVGIGLIYYQWEKYNSFNNSWISPSHRAVNIASPDLKFNVIIEEDEGVYHCIVTNDDGSVISDNAIVHVYGPPIMKFISNDTMSPEGDKVNLICSAVNDVDAIHPLQIYWYKGNKLVTPNGRHIILCSVTDNVTRQLNSTLLLDPVNRTDDGVYTCQAFNRNDSFSESKTTLIVQYPPFVSISNESPYMTNVGSLAILYCRAIGKPIPRVQWYKDNTTINPISSSFQQTFIVPTNIPHTTVYTCKGTNYIENVKYTRSASITVIVKVIKPCLPHLDAPVNGRKITIEADGIIKHISFSCNPNYVLKGVSLATCNDGVWSSSTPTCTKL